jgi:hypothetical protein
MRVQFHGLADPVEAIDVLARAVERTDRGLDSSTRVTVDELAFMRTGAAVVVVHRGLEGLLAWLDQLAAALSADGHAGNLTLADEQRPPIDFPAPRLGCMVAGLVFPSGGSRASRQPPGPGWGVTPAVSEGIAGHAVDWCLRLDGDTYFAHHGISTRVPPTTALELLHEALRRGPSVSVCTVTSASDFRRVLFDARGHVVYELRDAASAPPDDAVELIDVLKAHAATLDYGFLRSASGPSVAWWDALTTDEPRPPAAAGTYYQVLDDEEASLVPDAYGAQLLTEHHLGRARDLTDWQVSAVGERFLVQSSHLNDWFAPDGPSPGLVTAARADFGDMIISRELIRVASLRDQARRKSAPGT